MSAKNAFQGNEIKESLSSVAAGNIKAFFPNKNNSRRTFHSLDKLFILSFFLGEFWGGKFSFGAVVIQPLSNFARISQRYFFSFNKREREREIRNNRRN